MKFICTININKPKQTVVDYFINEDFLGEYQEGFVKKELITGATGKAGTVSKLYYKTKKHGMTLTETILINELPNLFLAQYHHKHTDNTMQSSFISIDENTTKYEAQIHYTALRGFTIKLISFLFPSFFKRQVQKWLHNFKISVENK